MVNLQLKSRSWICRSETGIQDLNLKQLISRSKTGIQDLNLNRLISRSWVNFRLLKSAFQSHAKITDTVRLHKYLLKQWGGCTNINRRILKTALRKIQMPSKQAHKSAENNPFQHLLQDQKTSCHYRKAKIIRHCEVHLKMKHNIIRNSVKKKEIQCTRGAVSDKEVIT